MNRRTLTLCCWIALLGALAQAACTVDPPGSPSLLPPQSDAGLPPQSDAGPQVADAGVVSDFDSDALSTCGDGLVQAHERCDDGNRQDSDGCAAFCGIGVVQLAVGLASRCARTASKQVYCWGRNNKAQLGLPDRQNRHQATLVPGVEGAIDLGAGHEFYCALMETGRVTCWGDSTWGALGFGSGPSNHVPRLVEGLVDAVALGVGFTHSCAVRVGGELVCWGRDSSAIGVWSPHGQGPLRSPLQVPGLPPMASVALGFYFACGLSSQGALYCWAGHSGPVQRFAVGAPHVVPELPVFSQLFGFGWSLCALTPDGETWCGGLDSPSDDSAGVRLVEGLQNVAEVVGMMHTSNRRCARLASGDVHCWAFEEATEKLELGERVRDFQVGAFARGSAFQVGGLKGARYAGCWLTESGKVLCNGSNYSGQLGILEQANWKAAPTSLERVPAAQELGWIEGGSVASSCVLAEDGRVVCWGRDDSGQVGDGPDRDGVMDPTYVVGLESVVDVSSRGFHACAAIANGQVFCWGLNNDGQLGDGGEENASAPVEVLDLTNTVEVVVGLFFSCARSATGTVYCWGKNDQGQIGDGTAIKRNRPVAVQGLGRVERLSLADNMACALKADGRVACWGANRGNLFLPRGVTHSLTPVLIDGLEGVAQLSVGGDHACAVGGDGRTTCWGEPFNGFGPALGGSGVDDFQPIAGLPLAEKVCNGVKHSCALLADGRVKCWGSNLTGQCGVEVGDTVTPDGDPIANLAGVTDFTCGDYTTCALLEDGNIQCWGLMPRTTGPENQYVVGLP